LLKLKTKFHVWAGRNYSQGNSFKFFKYKYRRILIFSLLCECAVCYLRLKEEDISEVLNNFVLRKTFRSKTEDVQEAEENCIKRNFMIFCY
jgi:hypothetical protein